MPKKNKLEDLRDHLFETLEALKDEEKPLELDRARTICNVAEQIIDSARVEVEFLEATESIAATEFFGDVERRPQLPPFEDLRPKRLNGKAS